MFADALTGSPFRVNVHDPSKASARGDGLDVVQCNQLASFFLTAPASQMKDFDVKIIGMLSRQKLFMGLFWFSPAAVVWIELMERSIMIWSILKCTVQIRNWQDAYMATPA